jgi:hypothetical protein
MILCGWMAIRQWPRRGHHPSDESLIANFLEHQAAFAKLIETSREEADVLTVYSDQVMLTNYRIWPNECQHCFSAERFSRYQAAFSELRNVTPYRFSKNSRAILIPVSFCSTEPDEDYEYLISEKGYFYSPTDPAPLVESLNGMGFDTKGTFYKKITGSWYLYHEWRVGKPE